MIDPELQQTILALYEKEQSARGIANILNISRNTVRAVLTSNAAVVKVRTSQYQEMLPILRELFTRCKGNAVRIKEILKEEYQRHVPYGTITHLIRKESLRGAPKRVGDYYFEPGEDMQHDTSPHVITLGGKLVKSQCASLVLSYSRQLFVQYYPCFTRFEVKTFLNEALEFMQGSCKRCVIDNTSVVLSGGSGPDAIISPEILMFSRLYGFEFMAHRIMHSDRKGRVERPFHYVENNFLPGRTFREWNDLNEQSRNWCIEVSNKKTKRILGASPEATFIIEKPHLIPLPPVLPKIYEHTQRLVDSRGFINFETNRYSVPERLIGKDVDVYKYPDAIKIYHQHKSIAEHQRSMKRYDTSRLQGHHTQHQTRQTNETLKKIEGVLLGREEILDLYAKELKKRSRGCGIRQLTRLLNLKRNYPAEALHQALKQAYQYGLYDLNRLEDLIIKSVAGNYFNFQTGEDEC